MVMSNEYFAKRVMELAHPEPFKPVSYYDSDGDCIEFFFSDDDYYAERVDELLTVYYSRQSGKIIGSLIKGVRKLYQNVISRYPGFSIEVQDGKIRLAHLFRARLWSEEKPSKIVVRTYQKLVAFADQYEAEAEASFA